MEDHRRVVGRESALENEVAAALQLKFRELMGQLTMEV